MWLASKKGRQLLLVLNKKHKTRVWQDKGPKPQTKHSGGRAYGKTHIRRTTVTTSLDKTRHKTQGAYDDNHWGKAQVTPADAPRRDRQTKDKIQSDDDDDRVNKKKTEEWWRRRQKWQDKTEVMADHCCHLTESKERRSGTHSPPSCFVCESIVIPGDSTNQIPFGDKCGMLRSYHHESTRSHQNSEVKRGWARLVLGWGITWEPRVLQCYCQFKICLCELKAELNSAHVGIASLRFACVSWKRCEEGVRGFWMHATLVIAFVITHILNTVSDSQWFCHFCMMHDLFFDA